MLLFEKTHKRCDKWNKESVGSLYLWLEIGSMPKAGVLETFEKYNSTQEATGSWNSCKIIPSCCSKRIDCKWVSSILNTPWDNAIRENI